MSVLQVVTGTGAYVNGQSPYAAKNLSTSGTWLLRKTPTAAMAYLYMAMPAEIRGRTILSATLSPTAHVANPAASISVAALASGFTASTITFIKGRPAVRPGAVTTAVPATAAKETFGLDVTAIVQSFANGAANFGFRLENLTNTAVVNVNSTRSQGAWTLTIELSPEQGVPTDLYPNAGVVGVAKPTVRFSYFDDGGDEFSQVQVQVSPTQNPATAFSATVTTPLPEVDLAATAYPGLASGATTSWRARVLDDAGIWSAWSDWATITYVPKPVVVLDNPTSAAILMDPSTVIQAHATSGTIAYWRAFLTRAEDHTAVLWDSGREASTGASYETALPDDPSPLDGGASYWVAVRAWDRVDRQAGSPTDPPYIEVSRTITFTPSSVPVAPTSLTAHQDPADDRRTVFTWSRVAAPDVWIFRVGGENGALVVVPLADATNVGGTWTWSTDTLTPNLAVDVEVFAVIDNVTASLPAVLEGYVPVLGGIWLRTPWGSLLLDGSLENVRTVDRRIEYTPPGAQAKVSIVTALAGLEGPVEGSISVATTDDYAGALNLLDRIRANPTTPVRIVGGVRSFPALISNLSWAEAVDFIPGVNNLTSVRFDCWQVGEFNRRY